MDQRTVLTKTAKGLMEVTGKTSLLPRDLRNVLAQVDGKATVGDLGQKIEKLSAPKLMEALGKLLRENFVRELVQATASVSPPSQMPHVEEAEADLDFTALLKQSSPGNDQAARDQAETDQVAREVAAAHTRQQTDAAAQKQAEAKARKAAEEKARRETEEKARKAAEEKARKEAEEKARREAEEKARREAEEKARKAAEEKVRKAAEEKARREAEEKARREAEEKARKAADEKARKEAEAKARKDAEERERIEAEERIRRELEEEIRRAEERAKQDERERAGKTAEGAKQREAEERARRQAEDRVREEAEAKARREAEDKARRDAEAKARKDAEEKAKKEAAEARARREAQDEARKEAEAKARREAEEKARKEVEERARRDAEERERRDAEERTRRDAEERARRDAEERERRDAEERERREAEERERREAEEHERREAEERERREAEERERREAEERARQEAEQREREAAARQEEDERRREEDERREAEEAEEKRKREEKKKARQEEKARAKAEAERVARERKEARAREKERAREQAEAARAAPASIPAPPTSGAPRRRKSGGVGRFISTLLFVAVVVGIAVLQFLPLDAKLYERLASERLGLPVRIESASFSLLPKPTVKLDNVVIGTGKEPPARIATVRAAPDLQTMLEPVPVLRSAELERVVLTPAGAAAVLWGKPRTAGLKLERIVAHEVLINVPGAALPAFDAEADLGPNGAPTKFSVSSAAKALTATVQPGSGSATVEVTTGAFAVPFGASLTLTDFAAKMVVSQDEVVIREFDGRVFGGVIRGNGRLRWGDTWRFDGEADLREAEAARIAPTVLSSGRLLGQARITAVGTEAPKLFQEVRLDGLFTVNRGQLSTIDLARLLQTGNNPSGTTPFNEMSGQILMEGGRLALRDVKLTAGLLSATANVEVDSAENLSGRLSAEIRSTQSVTRGNYTLAGTLSRPQLRR